VFRVQTLEVIENLMFKSQRENTMKKTISCFICGRTGEAYEDIVLAGGWKKEKREWVCPVCIEESKQYSHCVNCPEVLACDGPENPLPGGRCEGEHR
jgi:hypothetical protein